MGKTIRFDVAGRVFKTSLKTLRKFPKSTLAMSIFPTEMSERLVDTELASEDRMQTNEKGEESRTSGVVYTTGTSEGDGLNSTGHTKTAGSTDTDDAVYFLDRDADAFADILKYMRHPEAYTAPADPTFRYLVWSEARFYFMDGLLTRLGECYKDPVVPDYTDASFELSPGILSGLNRVPGCLVAYITRESATDSPVSVVWSDSGVGFPVYDSITDMRGLVLSFPYHHVRLSGVAISVNVDEVNNAAACMGERYPGFGAYFEPHLATIPEVALYGITAERKRVYLLGCRKNRLEPIRRCSIVGDAAAETHIGLYLSLEQNAQEN
ncbi:hypothetical protein SARC_13655 [Sphaeroforma arctica JP610]|uniref:Potassium channel tetramerisation-type BTB domain-containing protein n=1 Tax=Sphaeroforma arctica JP610 TaxID=667725 RepID=A0A0L0FCI2_9EUKA|nr:hypothetical protein SARC_13655 [Sphaeroforma arctica JP610]KNC73788.1 hypothetical protein SARC_13655 [Sphaeroforma arctica JP610]|eukprot:XP_014147690.1 hypothetical protein SARC_13655 [Sphaeroforma arctica JP610]